MAHVDGFIVTIPGKCLAGGVEGVPGGVAVVSSLVVQSVRALTQADLGYDPSRLLAAQIDVPTWKFADETAALRLRQRLVERVREIPGVQAAALATEIPSLHFASPTVFVSGPPRSSRGPGSMNPAQNAPATR